VLRQLSHRFEHLGLPFVFIAGPAKAGCYGAPILCGVEGNGCDRASTRDSVALLEHDSPEPTRERRWLPQLGERAIGLKERLLRRVFGELEVVEDRVAVTDGHVLKAADENAERLGFPSRARVTITSSASIYP
jgi:hypothetical protein